MDKDKIHVTVLSEKDDRQRQVFEAQRWSKIGPRKEKEGWHSQFFFAVLEETRKGWDRESIIH